MQKALVEFSVYVALPLRQPRWCTKTTWPSANARRNQLWLDLSQEFLPKPDAQAAGPLRAWLCDPYRIALLLTQQVGHCGSRNFERVSAQPCTRGAILAAPQAVSSRKVCAAPSFT
jgi:hypothetical protein